MLGFAGRRILVMGLVWGGIVAFGASSASAIKITEISKGLATTMPSPGPPAAGPDGNVWFLDNGAVAKITPAGVITEFSQGIPAGDMLGDSIVEGSDGAMWFPLDSGTTPAIGRIDPKTDVITHYALMSNALGVQLGPDGNVWFVGGDGATPAIGYITPSGVVKELTMGFTTSPPDVEAIAPGPDGNIWFLDIGNPYSVGHVAVKNGSYMISESSTGVDPGQVLGDLSAGPDGNMWFSAADDFGKIALPSGTVTEIGGGMNGLDPVVNVNAMTPGPDGNEWFFDQNSSNYSVGMIVPSTMHVHEFALKNSTATPWTMAFGSDGDLYVAQTGLVAQFTTAGVETDFPTPTMTTGTDGDQLIAGPDGNLYYNDGMNKLMVQVNLQRKPSVTTGAASAITTSGATIGGSVTPLTAATTASISFGTTTALGSTAAAGSFPASTTASTVSAQLTGLAPSTTYFYEVVANNANGTTTGAMQSFTTLTPPPPPTSVVTASFGNQRLSLTTPSTQVCQASTSRLPVSFTSVKAGSSKETLSFTSVSFTIDKGVKHQRHKKIRKHGKLVKVTVTTYSPNATARRVPATVSLSLKGLGHGSHSLTVLASYSETVGTGRKRHKESRTKTLKTHFSVC